MAIITVIPAAGLSPVAMFVDADIKPISPPITIVENVVPVSGDVTSLTKRIHPVDAALVWNFRVKRRSGAAVESVGQRYADIKKATDTAPAELKNETMRILQPFIDRGWIDVLEVLTAVPPAGASADTGAVMVFYRNLMSGKRMRLST